MSETQLLVPPSTRITCPSCEHQFSLEAGFARQALEGLEQHSEAALAALRADEAAAAEKRAEQLAMARTQGFDLQLADLRKLMAEQARQHQETLKQALAAERVAALAQSQERFASQAAGLEQRLQAQTAIIEALRTREIALIAEGQKLADERAGLDLEIARRLAAGRDSIATQIRTQEQDRAGLEKAELQKKLDDVSGKLMEAQRKVEQGSQQLQGEVLELAIEEGLRRQFPLDTIEEVKKGQRGGDLIHRVVSRTGASAGAMLWETKRARDWSPQWISKLKEDLRASHADIAILVTSPSATPKEFDANQQFGLCDDVWVTTWSTALQLAEVLRAGVLETHKQRLIAAGKGEKMEALYDYLTSAQFAQKLKAIYGAFQTMQADLQKERSSAEQRWARRDKQIQTGMKELLGFSGDVQGLAQQDLPMLELERDDDQVPTSG